MSEPQAQGRRKTLALVTSMPEYMHCQRVLEGVSRQCEKYGYNVAVFAAMVHFLFYLKGQAQGEKNIYDLVNFQHFDGVILDTVNLTEDNTGEVMGILQEKLSKVTDRELPVVCLGMPQGDYDTVSDQNEPLLRELCRHAIEVHGCKDICILTGPKGHMEAEDRLRIFLDEIHSHGLEVTPEHMVYGDFWYPSGEALAEELVSGRVAMPDAVICASDHMALGLMEKLTENGIRIPQDLIVLGFEATMEAAVDKITLTSAESNLKKAAADAVDLLRTKMEPGLPLDPFEPDISGMLHCGMSCGCEPDLMRTADAFRKALYYSARNYAQLSVENGADLGMLMENYISEQLTSSRTPEECINNIYNNTYIIFPFVNFHICLREDWLDTDADRTWGYPDRMKIVLSNRTNDTLPQDMDHEGHVFDTSLMTPLMHRYTKEPCIFYFTAVHFNEIMLGYAVLQRKMTDPHRIDLVYRNWLRFVNNSLEMVRTRHRYVMLSIRDDMTGLYNRRGMYVRLEMLMEEAAPEARLMTCVIDMDRLKFINDNYGHSGGDEAIIAVAEAVKATAGPGEVCVRAGGDEFFVIGVGDYGDQSPQDWVDRFEENMKAVSDRVGRPYPITASVGAAVLRDISAIDECLSLADQEMYMNKVQRKRRLGLL